MWAAGLGRAGRRGGSSCPPHHFTCKLAPAPRTTHTQLFQTNLDTMLASQSRLLQPRSAAAPFRPAARLVRLLPRLPACLLPPPFLPARARQLARRAAGAGAGRRWGRGRATAGDGPEQQ